MQRFLKRRADEDVDFNRDAGTHAQVPLGKRGSLLRYISISRSASMEVDAVADAFWFRPDLSTRLVN